MGKRATAEAYSQTFEGFAAGVNVLEDLVGMYYDQPSFEKDNPHLTSYREGRRAVIAYILSQLAQITNEDPNDSSS
ncbi:MAG: hypothetical protein HYX63_01560 [Gammaproteobacteria bacterium]|nr:hypothetical protein [Gammaproteobacteria bacterium]